ncbi:MAG: DUF2281 domain-containing protein [Flavobacteriaceae bacterium]|nr:DUF2281 domain-containing protein [Flavobacteriaceae bacterium]
MDNLLIYKKINELPKDLKSEVNDFIDFLLSKKRIKKNMKPKFGMLKGQIKMSDDFNQPIDDFKDYM